MSAKYEAVSAALVNDPELAARVMAAGSVEERARILQDAGLDLPTPEEIPADLAGVAGGSSSSSETVDCAVVGGSVAASAT